MSACYELFDVVNLIFYNEHRGIYIYIQKKRIFSLINFSFHTDQ